MCGRFSFIVYAGQPPCMTSLRLVGLSLCSLRSLLGGRVHRTLTPSLALLRSSLPPLPVGVGVTSFFLCRGAYSMYSVMPDFGFITLRSVMQGRLSPLPPTPSPLQGEGASICLSTVIFYFYLFSNYTYVSRLGLNVKSDFKQGGEACPSRPTRIERLARLQVFTASYTRLPPGAERWSRRYKREVLSLGLRKRYFLFFFEP
jgi:hypothetical protein